MADRGAFEKTRLGSLQLICRILSGEKIFIALTSFSISSPQDSSIFHILFSAYKSLFLFRIAMVISMFLLQIRKFMWGNIWEGKTLLLHVT